MVLLLLMLGINSVFAQAPSCVLFCVEHPTSIGQKDTPAVPDLAVEYPVAPEAVFYASVYGVGCMAGAGIHRSAF